MNTQLKKSWEERFDEEFGENDAYILRTGVVPPNAPQKTLQDVKQFIQTEIDNAKNEVVEEIVKKIRDNTEAYGWGVNADEIIKVYLNLKETKIKGG
jgi:hypothetical protein